MSYLRIGIVWGVMLAGCLAFWALLIAGLVRTFS